LRLGEAARGLAKVAQKIRRDRGCRPEGDEVVVDLGVGGPVPGFRPAGLGHPEVFGPIGVFPKEVSDQVQNDPGQLVDREGVDDLRLA
jgi:hypothetical protein